MGTTQGTTVTGTDVQHVADVSAAALAALDTQLIEGVVKSLDKANKTAGLLVSDMAQLAVSIVELHQAETWTRTIDGDTGKLFTSAKAFYASLNRQDRFPHLHRVLRSELVETLMDGDQLVAIGTNELAALIGCDPAQISRNVKAIAATVQAEPITEAELEAVAAEAEQETLASGGTEAEAAHAAEAARAEAKRQAEAEAERDTSEAEAKAKAEAEAKATDKAGKVFITAVQGVRDHFHLMTPERRAEVLKEAESLVAELQEFTKLQAEASAPKPKPRSRKVS